LFGQWNCEPLIHRRRPLPEFSDPIRITLMQVMAILDQSSLFKKKEEMSR
jgi:hypothetical protein